MTPKKCARPHAHRAPRHDRAHRRRDDGRAHGHRCARECAYARSVHHDHGRHPHCLHARERHLARPSAGARHRRLARVARGVDESRARHARTTPPAARRRQRRKKRKRSNRPTASSRGRARRARIRRGEGARVRRGSKDRGQKRRPSPRSGREIPARRNGPHPRRPNRAAALISTSGPVGRPNARPSSSKSATTRPPIEGCRSSCRRSPEKSGP